MMSLFSSTGHPRSVEVPIEVKADIDVVVAGQRHDARVHGVAALVELIESGAGLRKAPPELRNEHVALVSLVLIVDPSDRVVEALELPLHVGMITSSFTVV